MRNPLEVKVVHLGRKGNILEPENAEPIVIEGHVLERDKITRKVQKHGDSFFVSAPEGWLKSVANEEKVECCLVLTNKDEPLIIVSTPKGGES